MEDKVTGVNSLLDTITAKPSEPGSSKSPAESAMYGMKSPSWGAPTSLEGQDAASRLGIDMGEPTVKAAHLRDALLDDASLIKVAAAAGLVGRAVGMGKKFFGGLKNVLNKPGQKSRNFFQARKAKGEAARLEAKATRRADQVARTQEMTPGRARVSNALFEGKEVAREMGPKALGAGGLAWSGSDLINSTSRIRQPNVQGYRYGG